MNRQLSTVLTAVVPDVAKGVRAAVVMLVPFTLAATLHRPELSWTALGGWLGTLADPGGSRTTRARTIAILAGAGAVLVTGGESLVPWPILATLGLAVAVFVISILRAAGGGLASLVPSLTVIAAIAGARVRTTPLLDAAAFAAGALAAVILSSVVWPVWTHLPVRRAVARVYHELAAYLTAVAGAIGAGAPHGDQRWNLLVREHHLGIRTAIEAARAQALAVRARRDGETRYGGNVRALLGAAETQFPLLATLIQELEALPPPSRSAPAQRLAAIAANDREVERILEARTIRSRPRPRPRTEIVPADPDSVMETLGARLESLSRDAVELTNALDEPGDPERTEAAAPERAAPAAVLRRGESVATLDALRAALAPRSLFFHHAVRSSAAAIVASVVASLVLPRHGYWVTLTTLLVLQTDPGATIKRATERVVGTLFGSLVAVIITETVSAPAALAAIMVPLSIAAVATRPRSYRLFTFFLTPVFVLVSERQLGDWWTAAERAGDVVLGGLVALLAGVAIFPPTERERLPDRLVAMLDAVGAYAAAILGGAGGDVAAARRAAGVAIGAAEASLERFLAEPGRDETDATDAMLLVTYGRRLATALTSVHTHAVESGVLLVDPEAAAYIAATLADARAAERGEPRLEAPPPLLVRAPDRNGPTDVAVARALRWATLLLTASDGSRPRR